MERDLLWAHRDGMAVPAYVVAAFREAVELAEQRRTPTAVAPDQLAPNAQV